MRSLAIAVLLTANVVTAATPDAARAEVAHLLDAVEKSQCKFNRNGSWHDASAAKAHLQKKFEYLDKKDLVPDAERFIERGAAKSSTSGKPYQMQCAGVPAVTSADWLTAELKRIRQR